MLDAETRALLDVESKKLFGITMSEAQELEICIQCRELVPDANELNYMFYAQCKECFTNAQLMRSHDGTTN